MIRRAEQERCGVVAACAQAPVCARAGGLLSARWQEARQHRHQAGINSRARNVAKREVLRARRMHVYAALPRRYAPPAIINERRWREAFIYVLCLRRRFARGYALRAYDDAAIRLRRC